MEHWAYKQKEPQTGHPKNNEDDLGVNILASRGTKKKHVVKFTGSSPSRNQDKILKDQGTKQTNNPTSSSGTFNSEQMEQLYQMFSSLQTSDQPSFKS